MNRFFIFLALVTCLKLSYAQDNLTKTVNKIEFVKVEGGDFIIGCRYNDSVQCSRQFFPKPHKETFKTFYISKYEITVNDFLEFVNATGYITTAVNKGYSYKFVDKGHDIKRSEKVDGASWKDYNNESDRTKPVVHVSYYDCVEYCKWLSEKSGKIIRLPFESEWEYAARGGQFTNSFKFSGSDTESEVAWNIRNSNEIIHSVGLLKPNEISLYDMSGNVWEWTDNKSDDSYTRVRGGSFMGKYMGAYMDYDDNAKDYTIEHTGFRIVMEN